ncbi:hypothetical protein [Desulfomicrobium escambiense]|uniref:hypothetical protein n=1 Tax=Desulfomicrobium escambiense TaxID=29503 RepID=UPI0003F58AFB|nr:hypothetical protein [Desulfomicrobium escambiense]
MNTPHNPTDDILELTDIVEEGAPEAPGLDFAMDRAVDARSLDEELDNLLRDTDSTLKAVHAGETDIPFDTLPAESRQAGVTRAAQSASPQADLSDLDDLFGSLQLDDANSTQDSLDMLLDEKSQGQAVATDIPATEEIIDLDLEVPGLDADDSAPDLLELTDELLADIPETVLVPPADSQAIKAAEAPIFPSPEGLDLDIETVTPRFETAVELQPEPAQPTAAAPEQPEPSVSQAELEILSARLDALEARPVPEPEIRPEQVLGALPDSPDDLPMTRALREGIMQAVDDRLAAAASNPELANLRQAATELSARIAALETRPEPSVKISPEQVLAALPDSPDDLPMARTLRDGIMQAVDDRLAAAASNPELADLRQGATELSARIADLETRPEPTVEISPEQVLTALPDSPDALPLARALRDEILATVEAKSALMVQPEETAKLQQDLLAMQNQIDAMPEILAKLASTTAPALQELESGLGALRTMAQGLEQSLAGVQAAIARKDADLADLREGEERLREEIEALAARLEAMPAPDALKTELEAHVRQQVPAVVGRVIREEIQALLKELGA